MVVREYLNNIEVESLNRTDFRLTIDYQNAIIVEETDLNDLEFGVGQSGASNDAFNVINNWVNSDKAIDPIPYRREILHNGTVYEVFNGYFNAFEAEYTSESVVGRVYQTNGLEQLQRLMKSATFEYLYATNIIKNSDFVMTPYVIRRMPMSIDVYLVSFSTITMAVQLADQVQELLDLFADGANPFSTASAVAKFSFRVALILTLFIAIIDNLVRIYNLIIQPVKYHACMRVLDQMTKAFNYLGYEFKSSILEGTYRNLTLMPNKLTSQDDDDGLLGLITPNPTDEKGFFKGSLFDLVEEINTIFNAKLFILDNEVRLERRDYKPNGAQYTMTDIEYDNFKFNSQDFIKDFQFSFATDLNDKNTIQKYEGTAIQVINKPLGVNDLSLWEGLEIRTVRSQFALAKRKTKLYTTEKLFNVFIFLVNSQIATMNVLLLSIIGIIAINISVINTVISILNGLGADIDEVKQVNVSKLQFNYINPLNRRIDMIEMSADDVQIPKLFIINEGSTPEQTRLASSNETLLSAEYIYNNFYIIDSFKPNDIKVLGNQYKQHKIEKDVFTIEDYLKIRNNPYIYDYKGDEVELDKIVWDVDAETIEIDMRKNINYLPNFEEERILLNGK